MQITNSLNALQSSQALLNQTAQNIVASFQPPTEPTGNIELSAPAQPDLANEVVNLLNVRRLTEAQIRVIQTQDAILGEVIDLKA